MAEIVKKPRASRKSSAKKVDKQVVDKTVTIKIEEEVVVEIPIVAKTKKEVYDQYIEDNDPYKIYLRGQLIFDSKNQYDNPIFYEDYFILFGNKYIYRGIRFEKYQ